MDIDTEQYSKAKRTRTSPVKRSAPDVQIMLDGSTPKHIFVNSLKQLAQLLRPDICKNPTHYDCIMKVDISADDYKGLMIAFLTDVLRLTHQHHAIFAAYILKSLKKRNWSPNYTVIGLKIMMWMLNPLLNINAPLKQKKFLHVVV